MKKIGSIVLCLIMVIGSCGCQRKVEYDLTISVPYTSDYLKKTVELFEKEKDVKVNLQVYEGDKSDGESVDKYVNAMSAEILSGNGSDVICLTGLPYKKYIQLGALMPLDTIVDENQSTLYNKNVLEACKVDGGLFFMPITYSVPAILVQTDAAEVDFSATQTWEGFMENATEDLAENHYAIGQVDGQRLLSYAVGSDYSPYIDRESNQGNFSGDDFRELVMLCDKAVKKEQFVYTDNKYDEAVNKGQIKYVYDVFYSFQGLMDTCKRFDGKRRIQTLPHVGDGQGERFFSNDLYGINSKSEKQQLAGEFLNYMTSTDIQKMDEITGFPINNEALESVFSQAMEQESDMDPSVEKDIHAFKAYLQQLSVYSSHDFQLNDIVEKEIVFFFTGEKELDEVLRTIDDKVNIYLNE